MCGDNRLPDAGGVLDQDAELMRTVRVARNIYSVVDKLGNMRGAQIHRLTTGERRLIRWLRDGGYV